MLLVAPLFPPAAAAANSTIDRLHVGFSIASDMTVHEELQYRFASPFVGPDLTYRLSDPVTDLSALADGTPLLGNATTGANGTLITLLVQKPVSDLSLSFTLPSVVFSRGSERQFLTELSLPQGLASASATVTLPEGYVLSDSAVLPAGANFTSDGRHIIVTWNSLPAAGPLLFSVKYKGLRPSSFPWWIPAAAAAILTALGYAYYRRRVSRAFLTGFRDDEQAAIRYLQEHPVVLQRDLQHDMHFSRAKATRIVQKLEAKSLVKKEALGRTNRLYWVG